MKATYGNSQNQSTNLNGFLRTEAQPHKLLHCCVKRRIARSRLQRRNTIRQSIGESRYCNETTWKEQYNASEERKRKRVAKREGAKRETTELVGEQAEPVFNKHIRNTHVNITYTSYLSLLLKRLR